MTRSLTVEEQSRLVNALWEIKAIRRRATRDQYLSTLTDLLGHPLAVTRNENDLTDLWCLVESCLAYNGALEALVGVLEEFHGGSNPMIEARALVDELLPEPLFLPHERQELHSLARTLENGDLKAARPDAVPALYWDVVGPSGPMPGGGPGGSGDLRAVLARLEDLTVGVDGVPPLLAFVERLAPLADARTAEALLGWADRVADRLGLDRPPRAAGGPRAPELPAAPARTYLVIEFKPDGADPDRYLASAWLQYGRAHGLMLRCDDEDPLPFSGLAVLVADLLTENQQVVDRPAGELTLEFVLPLNLLGAPFDQLRITVDGLERRLGIEHPVVVRSLDRMKKPAYHQRWRRKWGWLRDNPGEAAVCWVTQPGQYSGESLYSMLLSELPSVCLAMAFPPPGDREPSDELRAALQAGAPIVAWSRRGRDPGRFTAEFQELLDQGALALPDNVLALRRQAVRALGPAPGPATGAGSGDDHLGFELTLVFDDADRMPEPYVRLNAPA